MPEFGQAHTQEWLECFRRRGYPRVTPLAAGVEGVIYDLADGTVAKVWGQRREAGLTLMQKFYADVAGAGLPFATPEILAVEDVSGTAVTFERKLPGQPLQARLGIDDQQLDDGGAQCVIEVLRSLASVPATVSMRRAQIAADLSYPAETLLIYQAAYAAATSNAFTVDGSDGHFTWCIKQLARSDVTAALFT